MSLQKDLALLFSSVSSVHSRNMRNMDSGGVKAAAVTAPNVKESGATSDSAVSSVVSSLGSVTPCPSTATVHPLREHVPESESPSQEPVSNSNSLSICITGTCISDKSRRTAVPPRDLGTFRTLVSGWETVTSPKEGQTLVPNLSSSSLNTNFECHSLKSLSSTAREQFFQNEDRPVTPADRKTVPVIGVSHRFAGADRLANRSAIYDLSPDGSRSNIVVSLYP
jgi:hypothetical protein